jgi:hypothetical protein
MNGRFCSVHATRTKPGSFYLQNKESEMKSLILAAAMVAVAAPAAPALAKPDKAAKEYRKDVRKAQKAYHKDVRKAERDWRKSRNYDWNRYESGQDRYYADRYYRSGSYYPTRRLGADDRIYRGSNGQYYCRRPDGTTGLIIGGLAGGLLGNLIAPGDSKTLATILGAAGGAVAGRAIDRNNVRCD